jgi:hypothetical protein
MLRFATLFLLLTAVCLAAGNVATGKWSLTATDSNGSDTAWTLLVKEEDGKLSGTLTGAEGAVFNLIEPSLKGAAFNFKVQLNEVIYTVETKIEGKQMTGKFSGAEASGTVRALKQE